ncbi:hypothetical protein Pth03_51500 [Planotetraspora thailandica]|uniref:DUF3558 domain-containing protein n=1 Tax=Planotetraspora thailandica TaxID=487172 RepID=A0A8J3V8B9_9ACTN|nr:hypothetical protein [Planotetraspora thailandica]GII56761.1 hypothetical protein Pth03_51500 [Planotetraspora thailandica]
MNSRSVRARVFRWATALSLITGALAVAGCGASAADPAPTVTVTVTEEPAAAPGTPDAAATDAALAGPVKACELVTKAEAEKLAGTKLADGVEGDPSTPACRYTGPPTGPTAQVEVYAGDGAKKIFDIDKTLEHKFTEVPGIGDEAHYEDNMIFFLKSGTWVGIRLVLLNDPAKNRKPMEELAATAASRL